MSNERELFEQFANEHKMSVLRVADAYSDDDTNYAWWVWQKARASTTMQDDVRKDALVEKAKKMYTYMTDNHPTIHTNRFPTWDEISEEEKNDWISKATKLG